MKTNYRLRTLVKSLLVGSLALALANCCGEQPDGPWTVDWPDTFLVSVPRDCVGSNTPCLDTKIVVVGATHRVDESRPPVAAPVAARDIDWLEANCANVCSRTPLSPPACGVDSVEGQLFYVWCTPPGLEPLPSPLVLRQP